MSSASGKSRDLRPSTKRWDSQPAEPVVYVGMALHVSPTPGQLTAIAFRDPSASSTTKMS